jgi:hypothetical protein
MIKFFIPIIIFLSFFLFISTYCLAAGVGFQIKTTIDSPTVASMKIIPWDGSDTIVLGSSNNIIDFNSGAVGAAFPGKNSIPEKALDSDDGWTAKSANVGFDLLCIGPSTSKLYLSCDELNDGAGHVIHHQDTYVVSDKTYIRKNFGVVVTKDFGTPPTKIYDGVHRMGPVGPGTLIDSFAPNEYSHMYHLYNWLNIPAETQPAKYFSRNYVITLI